MTVPREWEATSGVHNENVTQDDAYVEQQIGVVYGDVRRTEIYHIGSADPPRRRLATAIQILNGGNARYAEEALEKLVRHGEGGAKAAYYYALSVFSDRSLVEIVDPVYESFQNARRALAQYGPDGWHVAFDAVSALFDCVWEQDIADTLDVPEMGAAVRKYGALDPIRRDEIWRHLSLILGGAIQDHLDTSDGTRVAVERMADDRSGRAWKFFESEPAEPRMLVPQREPPSTGQWALGTVGVLVLLLGLAVAAPGISGGNLGLVLLASIVFVVGGCAAFRFGLEADLRRRRLASRDREHGLPFQRQTAASPGHWVRTGFVEEIHRRVQARFVAARPHVKGEWDRDVRSIREYYKWRFVELYGNAQVKPGQVDWLIRWHAGRVARQWQAGTLLSYRSGLRPSMTVASLCGLGVAGCLAGALMVGAAHGRFVAVALLLAVGAVLVLPCAIGIVGRHRHRREERALAEHLLEEEQHAHEEWLRLLADRPTDVDVARWLALDASYLKTQALRRCALRNRDLITHLVLTQRGRSAEQMRVVRGPWRYTMYIVYVFLLTKTGVREIQFDLDFLEGSTRHRRRTSFRYDALASARLFEVGPPRRSMTGGEAVRDRVFRLTLVSSDRIRIDVAGMDASPDETAEGESDLLRTALVSSGVGGALHVLESVTAEGRDWISREQERRRRRSREWRRTYRTEALETTNGDPFTWGVGSLRPPPDDRPRPGP